MKRTVRYTIFVLIAIINSSVITTSLYAVLPYNELHQLNMSNGLVDNIITCIYQDQDRFMWFGSSNGLSRYDGKQIRNFSVDNVRMYVSDIKETSDDKLWVIANENLYCFDRRKEKFVLPSFQNGKKPIAASAMEITGDSAAMEAVVIPRLTRMRRVCADVQQLIMYRAAITRKP